MTCFLPAAAAASRRDWHRLPLAVGFAQAALGRLGGDSVDASFKLFVPLALALAVSVLFCRFASE